MEGIGTRKLETERLILRKFTLGDSHYMFNNWASNPEVTKDLTWSPYDSIEGVTNTLKSWIKNYDNPNFYNWAIEEKDSNQVIGNISVVSQDPKIQMVHIGYCLGQDWWGKGYMSEALKELIRFFFEEVGVNRIESRHSVNNPASGRVMEKAGLFYEGQSRETDLSNEGISDSKHYALVKSQYKKNFN